MVIIMDILEDIWQKIPELTDGRWGIVERDKQSITLKEDNRDYIEEIVITARNQNVIHISGFYGNWDNEAKNPTAEGQHMSPLFDNYRELEYIAEDFERILNTLDEIKPIEITYIYNMHIKIKPALYRVECHVNVSHYHYILGVQFEIDLFKDEFEAFMKLTDILYALFEHMVDLQGILEGTTDDTH